MDKSFKLDSEWLQKLSEQLEGIEYGSVQITIHSGKIVQIDRTVRSRYDLQSKKSNEVEIRLKD